jgi:hypothetical protein
MSTCLALSELGLRRGFFGNALHRYRHEDCGDNDDQSTNSGPDAYIAPMYELSRQTFSHFGGLQGTVMPALALASRCHKGTIEQSTYL